VELGQLAFIGVVLAVTLIVRRVRIARDARQEASRLAAPYFIGSFAAFWFVERLAAY
jgi:hypothetical protein